MKHEHIVLVIDADEISRKGISAAFRSVGWMPLDSARYLAPALMSVSQYSAIVCDIEIAKSIGLAAFICEAQAHSKQAKIVLTSANPGAGDALDAVAAGAHDLFIKPLDPQDVTNLCADISESAGAHDYRSARSLPDEVDATPLLVGGSSAFMEAVKHVGRIAQSTLPVFLTGESGTGKEVIASVLHQRSDRSNGPFVPVNCAALPAELIESELFGHVRGSFTGADRDRPGLWEQADGGTIFLDEITETSTAFQVKLLRALQHGEVRRVGSNNTQRVDVRVIAASNRDVEDEVKAGRFRQDLFYRLNAVSVALPALRDRKEDIPSLVESFVRRFARTHRPRFSQDALAMLSQYSWPGNIRELENVVLGSVALCNGVVTVKHLPERIRTACRRSAEGPNEQLTCDIAETTSWQTLAAMQGQYVGKTLAHTKWNKQAAARLLGIDRKTLDRMIKRYKLVDNLRSIDSKAA